MRLMGEGRSDDRTTRRRIGAGVPGAGGGAAGARYLVVVNGTHVQSHALPAAGEVVAGRAADCALRLEDDSVSRRHARIDVGPPLRIEDLGSANGTRVGGVALRPHQPHAFGPGELVEVGDVILIVRDTRAAAAAPRLWTHGYFEGRLEEECAKASGGGPPPSVVRVRCERPIPAGLVADLLEGVARAGDVLAAFGPGEHELLLPATLPEEAARLRAAVQARLERRGVRARVGSSSWAQDGCDPHGLFARASPEEAADDPACRVERRPERRPVVLGPAMQAVYRLVDRAATASLPVLIFGETGTGKELVAEAIHARSGRSGGPFVRLNCAALPETLLESELFGHVRGAFTGAARDKPGLIQSADGGTLFLDELADLAPATQAKLLRVVEDGRVLSVGSVRPRPVDVRFVSATHRDLEAAVAAGAFRADLLYRLNGLTIALPPLRERPEDLEALARSFVGECCRRDRKRVPEIAPEALALLQRYDWPGNVRELRNVMERAVLLAAPGLIRPEHLPLDKLLSPGSVPPARAAPVPGVGPGPASASGDPDGPAGGAAPPSGAAPAPLAGRMRASLKDLERRHVLEALERCRGNQKEAARLLGVSRRTLSTKLDRLGIPRPRKGGGGGRS